MAAQGGAVAPPRGDRERRRRRPGCPAALVQHRLDDAANPRAQRLCCARGSQPRICLPAAGRARRSRRQRRRARAAALLRRQTARSRDAARRARPPVARRAPASESADRTLRGGRAMNAVLHAFAPYQGAALNLIAYLVTSLWIGAAVTVLALLVVCFWKPLDAATRYAVWYVALIAIVLGPLVTTAGIQRGWHSGTVTRQLSAPGSDVLGPHAPLRYELRIERPAIAVPPYLAFGGAVLWLLIVLGGAARFGAGSVVLARLKRDALPLAPERRAALPLWRTHASADRARRVRLCV